MARVPERRVLTLPDVIVHAHPENVRSPLCRGWCGGERSASDPPATIVPMHSGKLALVCVCCGMRLRIVPVEEGGSAAPNIRPGIFHRERRFTCDRCLYDTVAIADPRTL